MSKIKPQPPLRADFVRSVLDYDPDTGIFRWKYRSDYPNFWNAQWVGKIAGVMNARGYIGIKLNDHVYRAHNLAWLYIRGEWRPGEVDHRNRVRDDNRAENLRIATSSENHCNKTVSKRSTTGVLGVTLVKKTGLWEAQIFKDGRRQWRKGFATLEEAAEARRQMLPKIHGEFAAK